MQLSNSRIYLFIVTYKNQNWISKEDANQLSSLIADKIKIGIPDLSFKNIRFINVYESNHYSLEFHINKIKYKERRILIKRDVRELRNKINAQFKTIDDFSYEQIHVVNDEFSRIPTVGFIKEENLYV